MTGQTGTGYLIFRVNGGWQNTQPETNLADNILVSGLINFTAPTMDLTVSAATAPAGPVNAGAEISVSWTVRNATGGGAAGAAWYDGVYLSNDNQFDASDASIGSYVRPNALAAGATYTQTQTITLPSGRGGSYLLFVADAWEDQPETSETNNSRAVALTVNYIPPDLDVTTASVTSGTIDKGQLVTVAWTVKNIGTGTTSGYWWDQVYLSDDNLWDSGDATLNNVFMELALGQNATYDRSVSFTLPGWRTGTHLLVMTDCSGNLTESDETNNVFAIAVTYPSSDLTVTAVSTTPTAIGGTSPGFQVSYTVQNIAANPTTETSWYDAVYYSTDNVLDTQADTFLTSASIWSGNPPGLVLPLAQNGTYSNTVTGLTLPAGAAPGTGYIFVVADGYGYVTEVNNNNNASSAQIAVGAGNLDVTAAGWSVRSETQGNLGASSYGYTNPTNRFDFTVGEAVTLTEIRTKHEGTAPASVTLTLYAADGTTVLGSWAAAKDGTDPNIWVVSGSERLPDGRLLQDRRFRGGDLEQGLLCGQGYGPGHLPARPGRRHAAGRRSGRHPRRDLDREEHRYGGARRFLDRFVVPLE